MGLPADRCMPVHEGPFFYERPDVNRCGTCGVLITDECVRLASRHFGLAGDGNEIQAARSRARVEGGGGGK